MQMTSTFEITCSRNELTLAHAKTLVPPEFLAAWDWYLQNEGALIKNLPMGTNGPSNCPIKICAERGIHTPTEKDINNGWKRGREYALTIHSSKDRSSENSSRINGQYHDSVIYRPDGTWTFEYSEQKTQPGRKHVWDHNTPLMNCLEDGVPVGVIAVEDTAKKRADNYLVLGLGFVEQYNEFTGTFTIHGPVNESSDDSQRYFLITKTELSDAEREKLNELHKLAKMPDNEDEKRYIEQLQRERQKQFSNDVRAAYDGHCAISNVSERAALQAAHVDNYRGRKSQIVQNGILLRADLHLLYDSHLLGIKPNSHEIVLAESVREKGYEELLNRRDHIQLPKDRKLWPDEALLDIHYQSFKIQNHVA